MLAELQDVVLSLRAAGITPPALHDWVKPQEKGDFVVVCLDADGNASEVELRPEPSAVFGIRRREVVSAASCGVAGAGCSHYQRRVALDSSVFGAAGSSGGTAKRSGISRDTIIGYTSRDIDAVARICADGFRAAYGIPEEVRRAEAAFCARSAE